MAEYPKTTRIVDLKIYPIKSCRGFSINATTLTRKGLKYDRCCMFIDEKNKFITIRDKPEMTLIRTAIKEVDDDSSTPTLNITFPAVTEGEKPNYDKGATTISVPLEPDEDFLTNHTRLISAEIWGSETDAYALTSPEITSAVSTYFESGGVQLVMKGPTPRLCSGNGSPTHLGRTEHVNFPDVLPIQVASAASLRELNARLVEHGAAEITVERFRPNVIVDSDNLRPWEEDEWKVLRVNLPSETSSSSSSSSWIGSLVTSALVGFAGGSVDMDVVARCARCHVPNVDPDTAVPDKKEPWGTLYGYRRVDEGIKFKPCFGMLCCPRGETVVEVGMEMEIREVMAAAGGKGEHRYVKGF